MFGANLVTPMAFEVNNDGSIIRYFPMALDVDMMPARFAPHSTSASKSSCKLPHSFSGAAYVELKFNSSTLHLY